MSTYTSSLGLELITPGSQAGLWGNTTNNSLNLIDQAITGVTPISFASASGSTHTLTDYNGAEDEARAAVLNVTGSATGANTIVIPNKQKTYLVRNSTGFDVNIKTLAGSAYVLGDGYNNLVFCDGNNGVFPGILAPGAGTVAVNGGGTGQTSFTAGFIKSPGGASALTSAATVNASSEISGTLPVANGGTGAVSLTSGALLVGNGTGAVASLSGGVAGYVPTWNGSTWVSTAPASSAVSSVFGRTGAITAQSGDYSSYYYPLSSNPSGYATLSGTNSWSGANTFSQNVTGSSGFSVPSGQSYVFASGNYMFYNSGLGGVTLTVTSGSSNQFTFTGAGNGYCAGTWINGSDARIKENVKTLDSGLSTLEQLRPVEFSFKRDRSSAANRFGVIADELQQVLPSLVIETGTEEDGVENVKAVSYTELIPILIKAVQELSAEVKALKASK